MKPLRFDVLIPVILLIFMSCHDKHEGSQPAYQDVPFLQDFSKKYTLHDSVKMYKVYSDRNGVVQILTSRGLYRPHAGAFLYPGNLAKDVSYQSIVNKKIANIALYKDQFVYLDDKAVLSNAWAGKLYARHTLPDARIFAGGGDFDFLISDGKGLQYLRDSTVAWTGDAGGEVKDILFDQQREIFWILTAKGISTYSRKDKILQNVFVSSDARCFALRANGSELIIGTGNGYFRLDPGTKKQIGTAVTKLPWTDITTVAEIDGNLWFGSTRGAFMESADGKYNYYASKRWLPDDYVIDMTAGPGNSVLVLTEKGLAKICFERMTLYEKAMFYEKQVRERHIRYGFNCDVVKLASGDISTAASAPHDSDNLWTAMYLASQLFRYNVTHEEEAKQNCIEAFEAMERLHTIHRVPGFFGRSFERHGTVPFKTEYRANLKDYWYPGYETSVSWYQSPNPEWDWRGASSSDQTVGQFFALVLLAEYMDDPSIKKRATNLMDALMSHILNHNLRLVDDNGKATLWGIWHPEYVNRFPEMVSDRKLYSSNIISFLQASYHFTGKEQYRQKALELMADHGYLKNLTRPISELGTAPETADPWSRMLSEGWNHSDDEMYFLAYWGLYPYAFNDSLKQQYKEAIRDHWQYERPEKDPLWNFCYAMTGATEFDLNESIWSLQEFPLDMIEWNIHNSHRADLSYVMPNFRGETTLSVLPPDERPELKHNRNVFKLDREGTGGETELGGGDTFLLPYWMGRFLGVISAPDSMKQGDKREEEMYGRY